MCIRDSVYTIVIIQNRQRPADTLRLTDFHGRSIAQRSVLQHGLAPVSYTHLAVYKRQMQSGTTI